jgi:hypothetical protein
MAVNPTDISNTQEKTKKEIRDLFVLTTISAERSLDEADNVKEKPLSTVMNRIFKIAVEDF